VGSSRKSADGFLMSSTPTLARFRSPPLTPRTEAEPINVSPTLFKPSSLEAPTPTKMQKTAAESRVIFDSTTTVRNDQAESVRMECRQRE